MNFFDLILRLNGFPIREAKAKLAEIQAIPDEKYLDYVKDTRNEILSFHVKNNEFYKSFIQDKTIDSWEDVPILQKINLQKPLEERISDGYTLKSIYVNKTSGSSGHPFVFAKDKFCHALTWAEILNRFGWFNINFNNTLQARFYGIPLDKKGYYKERIKDAFSSRYRFAIFDLSDEKLKGFLDVFKRKRFVYINGYTSSIVLFAKYLNKNNIILTDVCPTLKYCLVTSEMLFDDDKKLLEKTFNVPVINEYGASELDLIAFTDKKDEFIVNSETLFVEILDENNKPVSHGNPGRIIITSLYNRAHPMIRYDIGDTGILHKSSTAKKPILEKLIGRTNDFASLPSGKTVPGLTFYYVTKSIIEDSGNVKEFIIEQNALDSFLIKYVSEEKLSEDDIRKIEHALFTYLEDNLKLTFEREIVLNRSNRGKLKQFISHL